jgi:hypothetical protein
MNNKIFLLTITFLLCPALHGASSSSSAAAAAGAAAAAAASATAKEDKQSAAAPQAASSETFQDRVAKLGQFELANLMAIGCCYYGLRCKPNSNTEVSSL